MSGVMCGGRVGGGGGMHGRGVRGGRARMAGEMATAYASYWNAFLFFYDCSEAITLLSQ